MKTLRRMFAATALALSLLPAAGWAAEQAPPQPGGPLLLDRELLALTRQRLANGDTALQASFNALERRADAALTAPLRSVVDKRMTPPSGSKNDYMSMGPYWWPNPDRPDGLPYIRKDGQRNPEVAGDALDADRMQAMNQDVRDLALAYALTGQERYARKAAAAIRYWFLAPATRMNPHLRFGQAIPGIAEGRGIGIIDTRNLWMVSDGSLLIAPSGALSADEMKALKQWFADFAGWMMSSPQGREEAAERNNHGMFFDAQLVNNLLFAGQPDKACAILREVPVRRFAGQIEPDGRMPLELQRTRPFHYSAFNLQAATQLARLAERLSAPGPKAAAALHCGQRQPTAGALDLWRVQVEGRSLRIGIEYLARTVADPSRWTLATQIEPTLPLAPALPAMLMARRAYGDDLYDGVLEALHKVVPDDVSWLLWPRP
jgi:Alginate lyase